ncbi:hypothetical protein K435DRAFT_971537 [Dendrothele bispora CBS 962.96]|uniref:F-box domain-containing protein n=1 Tax=Dendrothele bispora (strain CBS 962.96) TaxID=1314807 RepID=A0A4S8L4M0_DENBC|nr:hypothetical protein K435DRAFT_971537 [Dendrothele bispora CBS 962.96]
MTDVQDVHINDFPSELFFHIFSLTCDIDSPISFQTTISCGIGHAQILVLGQVCSRWRSIVISDSRLWSRIIICEQLGRVSPQRAMQIQAYANLHVTRSGNIPLDILVEFTECTANQYDTDFVTYTDYDELFNIYELLFAVARRWRNVALCIDLDIFGNDFTPHWPCRFPFLETLHVHLFRGPWVDRSSEFIPLIQISSAPRLKVLAHTGFGAVIRGPVNDRPRAPLLASIRSLTVSDVIAEESLKLASPATTVTLRSIRKNVAANTMRCLAREVRFSPVHANGRSILDHLFHSLTFPNITKLHFDALPNPKEPLCRIPFPREDFAFLLGRSSNFTLTHFVLINMSITDSDLLYLFFHMDNLTHLALGESCDPTLTVNFFKTLTYHGKYNPKSNAQTLCRLPRLKELHLAFGFVFDFTAVVFDMLQSRIVQTHSMDKNYLCLEVVHIFAPNSFKYDGIPAQINQMHEEGAQDPTTVTLFQVVDPQEASLLTHTNTPSSVITPGPDAFSFFQSITPIGTFGSETTYSKHQVVHNPFIGVTVEPVTVDWIIVESASGYRISGSQFIDSSASTTASIITASVVPPKNCTFNDNGAGICVQIGANKHTLTGTGVVVPLATLTIDGESSDAFKALNAQGGMWMIYIMMFFQALGLILEI